MVKHDAAARAAALLHRCTVAALGTLHQGAPSVTMVPYALAADRLAFLVLVSGLSAHTRDMLADPRVGLMVLEPEGGATPSHALARVSIQGAARPLDRDDPGYGVAHNAYAARFPDMTGLFQLGDFRLFAIEPRAVRVVLGFAQATSLEPATLAAALAAEPASR
jgi:putative heme iron utilization protein